MEENQIRELLDKCGGEYFFFCEKSDERVVLSNKSPEHLFLTASVIKVPLLLVWKLLEMRGELSGDDICDLSEEPVVEGAGFAHVFRTRKIKYEDVLTMMIAVSDNFCTNLVISRIGIECVNQIFLELGLQNTHLERKMMDSVARRKGLENRASGMDLVQCFYLINDLPDTVRDSVCQKLGLCVADNLFLRNFKGDSLEFFHKTGGLNNVINEWGFTREARIILLSNNFNEYEKVYEAFGSLGKAFLAKN